MLRLLLALEGERMVVQALDGAAMVRILRGGDLRHHLARVLLSGQLTAILTADPLREDCLLAASSALVVFFVGSILVSDLQEIILLVMRYLMSAEGPILADLRPSNLFHCPVAFRHVSLPLTHLLACLAHN